MTKLVLLHRTDLNNSTRSKALMQAPWLKNNSKSRQTLRTWKNTKPKKQVMKLVPSEKRTRKN